MQSADSRNPTNVKNKQRRAYFNLELDLRVSDTFLSGRRVSTGAPAGGSRQDAWSRWGWLPQDGGLDLIQQRDSAWSRSL